MKKLTIEYVRDEFFKEWYILLTKIYKNNRQKLEYICPNGHRHFISWGNWESGCRCPSCASTIKPTIEFIIKSFEKHYYECLTKEYVNSKQKLDYICPKGHRHSITWNDWQQGERCPYCCGNLKLTIEFIKECFENYNYDLLTKKYVNNKQKLEYICPEGHRHSMTWSNWQQGKRCPTCFFINKFGCGNPNWRGGISKEPYCQDWGKDLKEFVKERDDYKCMNPDCWGKDKTLSVHHINYNKKSCGAENLITVCRSCNSRANTDREWHEAWYKAIIYRRGYNYGTTI